MSESLAKAEALFHEALELPPEDREAFLRKACAADPELLREVTALLRASGIADHWLKDTDRAVVEFSVGSSVPDSISEGPGTVIGLYKLLEKIGEGGFGVVYMAEQEQPVRRRVALKIIKLGMDTRSVIARFEAERQALALMDHSNIAKVLDAGATDTGRPYFVMELVRGVPFTKFCEDQQLNTPDRLALFIQVCGAIQHAHQKGIIHRDIKPTNVLVTLNDGVPHPMVIDFGVAKALNQRLTEKTLFTNFAQMIGTPAYMSPEQAEMNKLDVDTRSDVYSLGVLLYELLTGTTPFTEERLRSAGYAEMQRIIAEEEPEWPSTRLRKRVLTGAAAPLATRHSSLATDLDWIVMKCLEKDRTRRYGTANGLAADLRRFLDSEPIVARPPSNLYRFEKLVSRNKLAVAAGAAVISALIIGLGLSTWLFFRERAALKKADENAGRADQKAEESRRNLYAADMILAQDALKDGNIGRAKALLGKYWPQPGERDLRGWEWRFAWNQCRGDELFTLADDELDVSALALSSNGATLASGSQLGHRVVFWNLEQKKIIKRLTIAGEVQALAFSRDEKDLIVGTADGEVTSWNCETWQPVTILTNVSRVRSLRVSPDGKLLAVFGWSVLTLWNLADRQELARLDLRGGREAIPGGVAFSPDSSSLAYSRGDGGIVLWDIATTTNQVPDLEGHERYVSALAFSADGSILVSGSRDRTVRIWDVATRKGIPTLLSFSSFVIGLSFSPDGAFLAVVGADQRVRLFETQSWEEINVFKGHLAPVWAVVFAPDGRTMMTGSQDGTIKCWPVSTNQQPISQRLPADVLFAGLLPGAEALYLKHTNQTTYSYWRTDPLQEIARYQYPLRPFGSGISPDGKLRFVMITNDVVKVFDEKQRCVADLPLPATIPLPWLRFAFSRDSQMLAGLGDGHICRVWRIVADGDSIPIASQVAEFPIRRQTVWSLKFSDTGRLLATGYADGIADIRDIASKEKLATLVGDYWSVNDIAISRDESLAVTAGTGGKVSVWDLNSAREIATFSSELGSLWSVTLSPDESRIAACGGMGTVRIWELQTRQEVAALKLHNERLDKLAFSGDGSLVVVAADPIGAARLFILRAPEASEPAGAKRDEDSRSAQAAPLATPTFSQRSAKTPAHLLDLSEFYNQSLEGTNSWQLAADGDQAIQKGQQQLGGIEFDMRGSIRLASTDFAYRALPYPPSIPGIKVFQKCRRLHFLHFVVNSERPGVKVATYRVHYSGQNKADISVKYGEDVRSWLSRVDSRYDFANTNSILAWTGTNVEATPVRLFKTSWVNPRPDVKVNTIDFISNMTDSSPVLVAITVER